MVPQIRSSQKVASGLVLAEFVWQRFVEVFSSIQGKYITGDK